MPINWQKIILLTLILGLPVGLYLFLQRYGTNQYQVPIFYQSGIREPVAGCPETTEPYYLPNQSFSGTGPWSNLHELKGRLTVFALIKSNCDHTHEAVDQLAAIGNRYRNDSRVGIMGLVSDSANEFQLWNQIGQRYNFDLGKWSIIRGGNQVADFTCILNIPFAGCEDGERVVLVDGALRLRGYFKAPDQEDMDRLLAEIEILLRNGEDT